MSTASRLALKRIGSVASLLVAGALILTGCASDPLADQYREGSGKGYIAGDGTVTEFDASDRGKAVEFSGTTDDGGSFDSSDYAGKVLVVNFWYAGCPPCRAEAPDLESLNQEFADDNVVFIGVNIRDQAEQSEAFGTKFGVTYPSILDADDGNVQLAFSSSIAPNAVPTTLVLDPDGKVASRILGQVTDPSILETLIKSAAA